jgi:hypothetical protein
MLKFKKADTMDRDEANKVMYESIASNIREKWEGAGFLDDVDEHIKTEMAIASEFVAQRILSEGLAWDEVQRPYSLQNIIANMTDERDSSKYLRPEICKIMPRVYKNVLNKNHEFLPKELDFGVVTGFGTKDLKRVYQISKMIINNNIEHIDEEGFIDVISEVISNHLRLGDNG